MNGEETSRGRGDAVHVKLERAEKLINGLGGETRPVDGERAS